MRARLFAALFKKGIFPMVFAFIPIHTPPPLFNYIIYIFLQPHYS